MPAARRTKGKTAKRTLITGGRISFQASRTLGKTSRNRKREEQS